MGGVAFRVLAPGALLEAATRHWPFLLAVALLAGAVAAVFPQRSDANYRAVATLNLRRTKPGADIAAVMQRRLRRVIRTIPRRYSRNVGVVAEPGSVTVGVVVEATSARMAVDSANNYAADLVGIDTGVDREAIIREQMHLRARLRRLPPSPLHAKVAARLRRLARRQITDLDFAPSAAASRVGGASRASAVLAAAGVGLLVALAAVAVVESAHRRVSSDSFSGDVVE